MNVQFEGIGQSAVVDNSKTITYGAAKAPDEEVQSGYRLDISGAVTDNSAYAGHGRTTEDIVCDALTTQVALQSQYLTVMSNSMSGEDFARLSEDGFKPCDTDIETSVTVVDEIKATLAEAGVVISGYNDDLKPEVLESITGDEIRAQRIAQSLRENDIPVTEQNVRGVMEAVDKAGELEEPNDGAVKYLVGQEMEPTIDNLYLAQHSGSTDGGKQSYGYYDQNGSGYYAKRAEVCDWDALKEQMEKVVKEAGMEADAQSMEHAKFLVEEGIPLTAENLRRLARVREISYPVSEELVIRAAAAAISDGRSAGQVNLAQTDSAWKQAVYWKEQADKISGEAVREVCESGGELNLRNLSAAQKNIEAAAEQTKAAGSGEAPTRQAEAPQDAGAAARQAGDAPQAVGSPYAENAESAAYIEARRRLEELRLQMTITANHTLIRKGYAIDTTQLSQLVEDLKAAGERARQTMLRGADIQENTEREALFERTLQARERLYMAPAALVGRMVRDVQTPDIAAGQEASGRTSDIAAGQEASGRTSDIATGQGRSWTLGYAAEQGEALKNAYEQAGERYETMMTQPRGDLGDSIRKAFRNVDEILSGMGLDTSEANRRAVRILGYNRMEITLGQIENIKDADLGLQRVVDKLTPSSVLHMIREGKNPLDMTVAELEQYLDGAEKDYAQQQEKYSEYLYRLERSGEITPEEKESYIGIYRLFRQIEKSDGAVIGSLLHQGAELTMKNLLSAVRTGKNKGINAGISDAYGALREIARGDITIDRQIMSAYEEHVCRAIYDNLEPQALHNIDLNEDPTMEEMLARMREASGEPRIKEKQEEQKRQYQDEALRDIRAAADTDEENIRYLLDGKVPVTLNYLEAAQAMRTNRGQGFRRLFELAGGSGQAGDIERHSRDGEAAAAGNGRGVAAQERDEGLSEAQMRFLEAADKVKDSLTDADTAGKAYAFFTETGMELLERQGVAAGTDYLDLKAYRLLGKQLSLAADMAREERYRIPAYIDGRVTALDVRVRHGARKEGHVSISMEHETLGKVGADFEMTSATSVSGYYAYDGELEPGISEELKRQMERYLGEEQIALEEMHFIYSGRLDLDRFGEREGSATERRANGIQSAADAKAEKGSVRTSDLYHVAKAFVAALQDTAGRQKGAEIK